MKKLRVGIIYGGRSGEHEVSLASAAAVFQNLDPARYEPVAIRIEKDGRWTLPRRPPSIVSAADVIHAGHADTIEPAREAHLMAQPGGDTVLTIDRTEPQASVSSLALDVVFPVLHGPYGEDGTVQGLLELANVPYVGAGVLASAVGMDKAVMKLVFAAKGLPICDYHVILKREWLGNERAVLTAVADHLGFPVFVKPANLGSSVGISKAKHATELRAAIALAAEFDRKIVIEAAVPGAREIECAVLGNDEPVASIPGEIVPSREFYDYEAKYLDAGSQVLIPAPLTDALAADVRELSLAAFQAIDGAGMARVDFLLAADSGLLFLNEVNTIPGFTTISMYAKMWEASGLPYPQMLDRLIALPIERHAEKQLLRTSM
ncbi:MAG: D-alanine--D-alanine ligase A [Acidobacteria bacterium RIFCSPLOWO2_12_FULL_66_10]|nr:MAG: D-alanine--D-alanine ligase A [Acidobacteria bacterium RIFCSPLOWO2_12_FULL_66_10]